MLFNPPAFKSSIKSIQRGTIQINSGTASNTATISSVTTAKATLNCLGSSSTDTAVGAAAMAYLVLTNGTTVTATRASTAAAATIVSYEVVEYN